MDSPMSQRGQSGRESEWRRPHLELYAGNLPNNISIKQLKNLFSKYKPKHIHKVQNERKCYAFIDFEDSETLQLAIKQAKQQDI
ncbi:tudor domain-containing protein 10-like [Microcaecilia unicolor]|uniref:Tudor domain-containing protein 10-like n=1 Tax=Microcaecilia unicolor TaxID=1415580 RepID=A0A6P7X2G8_9AMPH|nr:tudor domain-containing protein 10-like [Microcaecilia unicolor]